MRLDAIFIYNKIVQYGDSNCYFHKLLPTMDYIEYNVSWCCFTPRPERTGRLQMDLTALLANQI